MPLNLNDPEDSSLPEKQGPGPIFHEPGQPSANIPWKWIIIVLCVLLLGGGGYYAWKSDLLGLRDREQGSKFVMQTEEPVKLSDPVQSSPPVETRPPATSPPVGSGKIPPRNPAMNKSTGNYTIYISRQRIRALAEEEAGRWNAAGYEAIITEADGWFKLSIGHFESREEAKEEVARLELGFEAGYWIATISQ